MADKGRLTVDQKVKVVLFYAETKSVVQTQRRFRAHFGTRWAPCKQTIYRFCQQFETHGSVLEKKRPRYASVRTPANIEAVRVALVRSPSKSTRRASAELGISRRSLQTILHSDLHLFPYKITVMHKLTAVDKEQRLQFALWAMEEEAVLHNTWFTDEVCFYLNGVVSKQNVRFWARELPHTLHEKENMEQKLMCRSQFQPTESSVHFSLMTLSPKNDTRTCCKTVSSPISWQQVSLYTHSGSCRMEPVHTLQTWFLITCMRRLIFV